MLLGVAVGRQHLVDDVNHTVAGVHVRKRNCCSVDHDAVTDGEGQRLPVNRRSAQAVGHCRGGNCAANNVVEQNVWQERSFLLVCRALQGRCLHQ